MRSLVAFAIVVVLAPVAFAGGGAPLPSGYPTSVTLYVGSGSSSSVTLTWDDVQTMYADAAGQWQAMPSFDGSTWDFTSWSLTNLETWAGHDFTWDGSSSVWAFDANTNAFQTGGPFEPPPTQPATAPSYGPTTDPSPEGTDTGSWWDWVVHQFDKVLVHLKNLFSWLWSQILWLWDKFTTWALNFINKMWQEFIDYAKERWRVDFQKDYQLKDRIEQLYSMFGYVNRLIPFGKGLGVILTAWGACLVVRIARWVKSFIPTVGS